MSSKKKAIRNAMCDANDLFYRNYFIISINQYNAFMIEMHRYQEQNDHQICNTELADM